MCAKPTAVVRAIELIEKLAGYSHKMNTRKQTIVMS